MTGLLWTAALLAGCRLPGREGPVPQSLADCRRLSQRGAAALERGQQQDAESLLAKAVAACPVDAEARRHYAEALWRRGAREESIVQMDEAQRLTPEDAALCARLAEMNLACGQLERASQNAERAVDLDPKLPGAWMIRGKVICSAGRPRQALADCLRALGYAPHDRAILLEVADLYRQLDEPQRALQTLQTLAETYPPGEEPGQVLYLMGLACVALRRYDDGVENLSAALIRDNPTAERFHRLAEAELLAGHPHEAAAAARQALTLEPQHQQCLRLLDRIEIARRQQQTVR
jgi:tetratricopeptide (TPR) repeat protein